MAFKRRRTLELRLSFASVPPIIMLSIHGDDQRELLHHCGCRAAARFDGKLQRVGQGGRVPAATTAQRSEASARRPSTAQPRQANTGHASVAGEQRLCHSAVRYG